MYVHACMTSKRFLETKGVFTYVPLKQHACISLEVKDDGSDGARSSIKLKNLWKKSLGA